jgi:hypothetical protein
MDSDLGDLIYVFNMLFLIILPLTYFFGSSANERRGVREALKAPITRFLILIAVIVEVAWFGFISN